MIAEVDIFQRESGSATWNVWWEFKGQILANNDLKIQKDFQLLQSGKRTAYLELLHYFF